MRSVLVTGASSGIGRATALRLDAHGWRVFAGIRTSEDADSLSSEASGRLKPIIFDVADDDSIERAAMDVLTHHPNGLDGLVNNAGVAIQGPLEHIDRESLGHQFDVNVSGQIAVTQRFLSPLRTAGGRIVFVSSVQGVVESVPLLGPYCASKRALEAVAETFRLELRGDGIPVCIVAPGTVRTTIWDKAQHMLRSSYDGLPPTGRQRYRAFFEGAEEVSRRAGRHGVSADRVAGVVAKALESRRPRRRYGVGDARLRQVLEASSPKALRDLLVHQAFAKARRRRWS